MRVFATGATGFVGTAVVRELITGGHEVIGLARSEKSAAELKAVGAEAHHGSLDDVESLKSGASKADGVIHMAFGHDFSKFAENCEVDRRAIDAFGEVFAGTNRPVVVTSGILLLTPGKVSTEEDAADTKQSSMAGLRARSEETALALVAKGVRVSIIRLPPSVHGEGDKGFVPMLFNIAQAKGESSYIENGQSRWPSVHRFDSAKLYRLALESAPAGSILHAVADESVPIRDIATVIGQTLDLPVTSKTTEEAGDHFGFLAFAISSDNPSSSILTQKLLGWSPTEPGLLEDIKRPHYYRNSEVAW